MKIKKVYICSPVRGDYENNIKRAKNYARLVYNCGNLPVCVHGHIEDVTGLSEKNGDRTELLKLGKEFVKISDEVWVFGKVISEGMKSEIKLAKQLGIKVKYFEGE